MGSKEWTKERTNKECVYVPISTTGLKKLECTCIYNEKVPITKSGLSRFCLLHFFLSRKEKEYFIYIFFYVIPIWQKKCIYRHLILQTKYTQIYTKNIMYVLGASEPEKQVILFYFFFFYFSNGSSLKICEWELRVYVCVYATLSDLADVELL